MMMKRMWLGLVCLLAGLAIPGCVQAQAPVPAAEQAELTRTVAALDTKLFDAYNHCDLKTLGEMVSDDLEFYHDQTGLMVGILMTAEMTARQDKGHFHVQLCLPVFCCMCRGLVM